MGPGSSLRRTVCTSALLTSPCLATKAFSETSGADRPDTWVQRIEVAVGLYGTRQGVGGPTTLT
jgi:hypothetical protein